MVKPTRASPKPGRGDNGPAPDAIMQALAVEMLDQDALKAVKERRKRNRTKAEAEGVNLSHLDRLYSMRDDPPSKVEEFFRGMWHHLTAHFTDLADQMDMFVPKATREAKAAFHHAGLMAGLKGEKGEPPKNLDGDEMNQWIAGHNKGAELRGGAEKSLAETMAKAMKIAEAGGVVDGKTGDAVKPQSAAAKKAQEKAAQDAAADAASAPPANPALEAPPQPDWTGFDEDPLKWTPEQSRAFRVWFDSVPKGAVARFTHVGVRNAFRAAGGSADEFEEAKPEELEQQKPREAIRKAKPGAEDETDPLVVGGIRYPNKTQANAARALVESQSEKAKRLADEAGI